MLPPSRESGYSRRHDPTHARLDCLRPPARGAPPRPRGRLHRVSPRRHREPAAGAGPRRRRVAGRRHAGARPRRARARDGRRTPPCFGERRVPGAPAHRPDLLPLRHQAASRPDGWLQPSPFEPVLRRGPGRGRRSRSSRPATSPTRRCRRHRLYARGASDDKGPIWAHLEALALMDALGIVAAGQPEVHLRRGGGDRQPLLRRRSPSAHRDLLAADLVLVTDGPKDASGRPTVAVRRPRRSSRSSWCSRSARRDVHSGNFSVPNPAWRLTGLLASMAAPDGTPLIEGLEEDVAAAHRRRAAS